MSPARMNTPAAAPIAAPRARPVSFSVSSALASAISSLTSSWARSETSSIAVSSSDLPSCANSVHQPLEDAREQERAGEDDAGLDLGTIERAGLSRRRRLDRRPVGARGGRGRRRGGLRPDARAHHARAADRRGRDLRRGHLDLHPRGLVGLTPALLGLGLRRGRLLAGLALLARKLLLGLLRLGDLVVGLRRLLLGLAYLGLAQLGLQLGAARQRRPALGLLLRELRRGPLLRALGIVLAHSGGSSPKTRRKTTAATRVVTIEASAPIPASSPDQAKRLTMSLSVMAAESRGQLEIGRSGSRGAAVDASGRTR